MNKKDTFQFFCPATLEKTDSGAYKIKGLASTANIDDDGEIVRPEGLDLNRIDKGQGVLNWNHGKGPENVVGMLTGYDIDTENEQTYVEGELFKKHKTAGAVIEIMDSLKSSDIGRMGMSIEGKVIKRNKENPKIIEKCEVNAVALTLCPVNSDTYVDFMKSISPDSDIEFKTKSRRKPVPEESTLLPLK